MTWLTRLSLMVKVVLVLLAVVVAIILVTGLDFSRLSPGPTQPVPFSHRLHAGEKGINCFFCHPYAGVSANAGLPPLEKCLLCHNVIAPNFEPVAKIHEYDRRKEAIPWVRVVQLPDFVRFNHQCHIAGGHDCSDCHGDIKGMDRVKLAKRIDMNLCVTCHWNNGVPTDCFLCHY